MSDYSSPIFVGSLDAVNEVYVDWEGVDFLVETQDAPIVIELGCPGDQKSYVESHTRTTFRSALIASLLETDAMSKSRAFQQWLRSRHPI